MGTRLKRFSYRFAEQVLNSKLALKQEIKAWPYFIISKVFVFLGGFQKMKENKIIYALNIECNECFKEFNEALAKESSDRARLIIAAAWIDYLLKVICGQL